MGRKKHRRSHGFVAKIASVSVALLATACSGEQKAAPTSDPELSAAQLCDGTLNPAARSALKRITKADIFREMPGKNDWGEPEKFSLTLAAKTSNLSSGPERKNECDIFLPDATTPFITIGFIRQDDYPEDHAPLNHQGAPRTYYPISLTAFTTSNYGAEIYFKCPLRGKDSRADTTKYINAGMIISATGFAKATGKDRMTILLSVARRMADEIGCAEQAGLPAAVPAPLKAAARPK